MMRWMVLSGLAAALLLTLVFVLSSVASAFSEAQQRSVQHKYIDEQLSTTPRAIVPVTWSEPVLPLDRLVNDADKALVGRALWDAWSAHSLAGVTGETAMLADYFSGVALDRAARSALTAERESTAMVVLRQDVRPRFFHIDGSVMQTEIRALSVRAAPAEGLHLMGEDRLVTTLMNETTGWRVFSHERTGHTQIASPMRAPVDLPALAGVNYYPAQTPWRAFWPSYDSATIAADFQLIRALGANAVRIFLPRADFLPDNRNATHEAELEDLLLRAEETGLLVVPTLFDLKADYRPSSWADDVRYLDTVLPTLAASPNIAFVDLKNEPDLDFATHGADWVEAWARTMIVVINLDAPDLPVTIGWATPSEATRLLDVLDLVTYHDYGPLAQASERLSDLRAKVHGKTVMVTEIGASSWSVMAGLPGSPNRQAHALSDRMTALAGAEGLFVWTLHDFPEPDEVAVGNKPWVRAKQSAFGLYDTNGIPKPAADAVRQGFTEWLAPGN